MIKDNLTEENVGSYAEVAYLEYAMSVVKGRAIPSVEDGLKPVHRRIIYAMSQLGLTYNAVPKKCARVVGETIGRFHPHGDQAVYDSMVRQSQSFSLRYPLVHGEGNFGSRDGDSAAAMRYTEAKLRPISHALLEELNEDTVDFVPNYDNSEVEPRVLPSRIPLILLNGNPGIGVGIATNIPPHNLNEVVSATIAYLENEKIGLDDVLKFIKAPDFPTKAIITSSPEEIRKMYAEGRGSVRLRSRYLIENEGKKDWQVVFYEIPDDVNTKKIIEAIDSYMNPTPKEKKGKKGEKSFTSDQIKYKQLYQNIISEYDDESDKDNPVRIVIKPKSSRQDPQELVNILLASTGLESSFKANFVLVGRDGVPCQKPLMDIISEWVEFRLETIERRTNFRLRKTNARIHILEGREIVLTNINEVIKIIQHATDPKLELMERFSLSEIQATDVLDLRLRQISNLEMSAILKELDELNKKKAGLEKIISSRGNLKKQAIKESREDMLKYGDDRLTEVYASEKIDISVVAEKSSKVLEEKITLGISEKGWVRFKTGSKAPEDFVFKEGDSLLNIFHCKNTDLLAVFDSDGKVYNYPLSEIQKDNIPISTLISVGKIEAARPIVENKHYLLTNNKGFGFIVNHASLTTKVKTGKAMISLVNNGNLLLPNEFDKKEIEDMFCGVITSLNKILIFKLREVSEISKGKGVVLIKMEKEDFIKEINIFKVNEVALVAGEKKDIVLDAKKIEDYVAGRATKGKVIKDRSKILELSFKKIEG